MATKALVNTETRIRGGKRDHYTSSRPANASPKSTGRSPPRTNNVDTKTKRATSSPGREETSSDRIKVYSKTGALQKKNITSDPTSRTRAEDRPRGRKNSKTSGSNGSPGPVSVSKLKNLFDKTIADEQEKAKSSFRPVRPHSEFDGKVKKSQESDRWSLPSYAKKSAPPSHKVYVSEGILAKRAKFAADSSEDIAVKKDSPKLEDLVPDIDLDSFDADFRSRSKSDSWVKPLLITSESRTNKARSSSAVTGERVSCDDSFTRKPRNRNRLMKSKSADALDVDDSVFESDPRKGFSKDVKGEVQRHLKKGEIGKNEKKKYQIISKSEDDSHKASSVKPEKKKYEIIRKSADNSHKKELSKKNEMQPWEKETGKVKRATWFDEEIPESEKHMELESVHLDVKVETKKDTRTNNQTTVQLAVKTQEITKEKSKPQTKPEVVSEAFGQKYKAEKKPEYIIESKTETKPEWHVQAKPKVEIETKPETKLDFKNKLDHKNTKPEPVFVSEKSQEKEEDVAQSSDNESEGSMVEHSSMDEEEQFESLKDVTAFLDRKPLPSVLVKGQKKEKQRKVEFGEVSPAVHFTYSPLDYDRGNESIDPVTASAEWELEKRVEKMDVFSVDLVKDNKGLGLSIIGLGVGTDTGVEKLGIFVKSLTENGAAEKDGRIQVNDQIIEVDGVSLVGVTQQFAAQTLKHTSGTVRFLMGREKTRFHHLKSTDTQLIKEVEELKQKLQVTEERASKAEEKARDTMIQVASLRAETQKVSDKKAPNQSQEVKELEKQVQEMTEKVKETETDLAIYEAENQDMLKQLEEGKGHYLILEKKYQTTKNKLKEHQEREQAAKDDLLSKSDYIKSLENQVRDLQNAVEELRKTKLSETTKKKIQKESAEENRTNVPKETSTNESTHKEVHILKKSKVTDVAPHRSHKEVIDEPRQPAVESEVQLRNVSLTAQSPLDNNEDLHRFSYIEGDSLFPSEWKDPTKLDLILDWKKPDGTSKKKEVRSSSEFDLNSVPETDRLNNEYSLDKIRIAEQQEKKHKPTRASYGRDFDGRDEIWKAVSNEDEDEEDDPSQHHHDNKHTEQTKPSGPGLFLPNIPVGGFKLKSTGRNLKDDSDVSKQQSSHELTRSSFPLAGRDQMHGIVVENLLDKQLTKADVKVSSLPSAFGQGDKAVNKLSDSQDVLDASHNSLQEIEEAKRRIDSDLHSSMASSRGSSPFLPPAMPLLEVYNEAAIDVPPDFENVASSPSDESLAGGSLEVDSGSIDSRSVGSSNAVAPTSVRSPTMWTSRPVAEWDTQQVGMWLLGLQLDEYRNEFANEGIDGKKLLAIDNSKLKAMGLKKDHRTLLKKNVKQLKLEAEKEQKAKKKEEKEQKAGNLMTKGKKGWKGWKGEYTVNSP